ncbi:anthranilate synthase component I [Clostridium formicaceticum]|uniref:Anthranilate synthase component 1 n=1 Tax=Clostridium formicaceticum TaxID=1497 RepID=A0AAC9RKV5_9CLOT|nr:anthranilate synthase component I [Clostridium formicaceticum]AOY75806.1 anthranilate synthase component I [Clostridium formicaceticum]ARE86135.1 Anthranilate synthase component 1 [Clostridium formicaceticum]
MIYPTYHQFKDLSKTYKMIPISMEIQGDTETPITLFKKLCNTANCYLLESVEGGEKRGRYSYIGRKPFIIIKGRDNQVTVVRRDATYEKKGKEIEIIKEIMKDYEAPQMENMPDFIGGGVGYIGYDIIRNYEKLPCVNEDDMHLPLVHLLVAEEIIVYDHVKQKIKIIINLPIEEEIEKLYENGVKRLKKIQEEILKNFLLMERNESASELQYKSNETKDSFMEKVRKAKAYIRNGDIFQVVLSQRLQVKTELSPFEVYRNLRSVSPSPYLFYIDFGDYQLTGSSPELLVKVKDQIIETCPIAGTRPRGKNAEEDELLAKDLLADEKEKAEHLMLVDLARNDIGKLAEFGSVEVSQYMEVCRYSHVMHIVSNVIGKLKKRYDMYDALVACLPAGTLSGAPKVRAMEIIDELENKKRGIYGGAVGYLGFNGNMDMCIAIRSIVFKEKQAYLQAGAGIVADSNEEEEYKETLRKLEGLMVTMNRLEERVS